MRPRLLDLFCGAGGCSVGYHRAGFDVVGVDIDPHPDYPYEFHQADALTFPLEGFDVVHASPPCQRYAAGTADRSKHPDLVPVMRERLTAWCGVWIMENVPGAPLHNPTLICGQAMGLPRIRRHRLFESNAPLMSPGCACSSRGVLGVYGHLGAGRDYLRPDGSSRGRKAKGHAEASEVMGIDWMTKVEDITEAIPPAYTEYLGAQLLDLMNVAPPLQPLTGGLRGGYVSG